MARLRVLVLGRLSALLLRHWHSPSSATLSGRAWGELHNHNSPYCAAFRTNGNRNNRLHRPVTWPGDAKEDGSAGLLASKVSSDRAVCRTGMAQDHAHKMG